MLLNDITYKIRGCLFKVHSTLGPGLLEKTYELCLAYELQQAGLNFRTQVELPIRYGNVLIDGGYRLDLLVEDKVIVELKSVEALEPIHTAQLITYLKLSKKELGLLVNFNVLDMKKGIQRIILDSNQYKSLND
jgi:GxxExxY protein